MLVGLKMEAKIGMLHAGSVPTFYDGSGRLPGRSVSSAQSVNVEC